MAKPRKIPDADRFSAALFADPPVEDCPVTLLGHIGDRVVFTMPEGVIRELKANDVAKHLKMDLFNCAAGQLFLDWWRGDDGELHERTAAIWFVRKCRELPMWDAGRAQRGLGVWPGPDGTVVLHRGSEIWTYTTNAGQALTVQSVAEAMRARNGPIYALQPDAPAPTNAANAEDGRWIRETLDAWHWEMVGSTALSGADLCAGWIMASLMGAVAPFRPHFLMRALMGSGKTTLMAFVHGLLSALAGDIFDDFTRAGLANNIAGMARPVLIDEAESSPNLNGLGPVEEALGVLRRMATGDGGKRKMGTVGGGSRTQTAVGAVFMGAVNPVKLTPQDASRIVEAKLLPLNMPKTDRSGFTPTSDAKIEHCIETARQLAPALLGRALVNVRRYKEDVALLKEVFREQGREPRVADLVAALAAGRRLMLSEEALDSTTAAKEAELWRGLLEARAASEMVPNPGELAIAHLLNWPSGKQMSGRVVSLGDLVEQYVSGRQRPANTDDDLRILKDFGLLVAEERDDDGTTCFWLLVANNAPGLVRIFDRTNWRDWRKALEYLDALGPEYRTRIGPKMRFGVGVQSRSIQIPLDPWLPEHLRKVSQGCPKAVPGQDID